MDFFETRISPQAVKNAAKTLRSSWISEGRLVLEFERRLASSIGLSRPVALNSGTSALHLALALAEVGPGDEVIIPAQTFVATGLVVLMQGATPVFADIQHETGNLDPQSFARKITKRTKAVIPVHWAGYPCDMDQIGAIARRSSITVIEDAAHALGAVYKGRRIGAISRFTALSFQAIKHLTTGDGGALCCLDEDDERQARTRRWFGIDRTRSKPSILGEREYDISAVGYKYHLNDLGASIGLGNLAGFPAALKKRRSIDRRYRRELAKVPGITLLESRDDRESACWLFTMHAERREDLIRALKDRGVPASVVHLRIDKNSVFGGLRQDLPEQARFNETQVALPVHPGLTESDVCKVIAAVKRGW